MSILRSLYSPFREAYSVIIDQSWYWNNIRPRLDGVNAFGALVKYAFVVWLVTIVLTTLNFSIARLFGSHLTWLETCWNSTKLFGGIMIFAVLLSSGLRNRFLWCIPLLVTLGTLTGFFPLLPLMFVSRDVSLNIIAGFFAVMMFSLGLCFGISAVVALGEGIIEMIGDMLRAAWKYSDPNIFLTILMRLIITLLVALLPGVLIAVPLWSAWKSGIFLQMAFIIFSVFAGWAMGESWAARQVKDVHERKYLAKAHRIER